MLSIKNPNTSSTVRKIQASNLIQKGGVCSLAFYAWSLKGGHLDSWESLIFTTVNGINPEHELRVVRCSTASLLHIFSGSGFYPPAVVAASCHDMIWKNVWKGRGNGRWWNRWIVGWSGCYIQTASPVTGRLRSQTAVMSTLQKTREKCISHPSRRDMFIFPTIKNIKDKVTNVAR